MNVIQTTATLTANRLTDRHYKECVTNRGLCPEWVAVNCRSMEIKEATQRLGYTAQSAGIWLEGINGFGQYRPNKPWKSGDDKKAPKYRTAAKEEYDAVLPRNPHNPCYWEDLEALKALCHNINGHPCLLLTEGLFKAIAGCSNGFPAVALVGVEQGLTPRKADVQGRRYLVTLLEKLASSDFGFIICFDADEKKETRANVAIATRKLAQQLAKFKVPVYIATGNWAETEGKGMDDFIKANGADAFRENVLNKAVELGVWEQQFVEHKGDDKLSEAKFSQMFEAKYRGKLAWNVPAKSWYLYESKGKAGIWGEIPSEEATSIVITELKLLNADYTYSFVNAVLSLLKAELRINEWEVIKKLVCLEDCVVNIETLEVSEHQPGYRFLSGLPYKWSDHSVGCEPIKQWLLEACGDRPEWVEVIRACINATITERGGELQRFIELVGAGGAGKGTLLRIVQQLLGRGNYEITTLKEMEENRFEAAKFYGKKAIFITDSDKYASGVSRLKALTGDDEVPIEKKNVQQTGSFRFTGIVWIAANEAIQSTDYTNGLARRRLSLSFNKSIPVDKRRDLMKEFEPYFPGLLFWALSMDLAEVADLVSNTSKRVASIGQFISEILLETNPLANWADQNLYYDPATETKIGDARGDANYCLYANYSQWASANGCGTMTTQRFSSNLLNLLKTQLAIDAVKRRTQKGRFITCIGIRQPGHNFPLLISDKSNDDSKSKNDDPMTTRMTTQTLINADTQKNDDLLINFHSTSSPTTTTCCNSIDQAEKIEPTRHFSSTSASTGVSGHHEVVIELSSQKPQVVIEPSESINITTPKTAETYDNADTQPILNLSQQIAAVWNSQWELGNLILVIADTDELRAEVKGYTPEKIKHIKAAANFCWSPAIEGKASKTDWNGELKMVWGVNCKEIKIGNNLKPEVDVKRGNLKPWLGI